MLQEVRDPLAPSVAKLPRNVARLSPRKWAVLTGVLAAVWYALSGKVDLLHLGTGVLASAVIAASYKGVDDHRKVRPLRLLLFLPWLLREVTVSNLRVARLVLSRRMDVRPSFVRQPPGVKGDRALALVGAAVTLTPGTLAVEVTEGEVLIHALDERSAEEARDGLIARKVADLFAEAA